jgi:hypothetical protein
MDKIIMDLKKKIENYTITESIIDVPPYASIKASKEELYKKQSATVIMYNRVCDSLCKLQYSSVTIDRLLKEISNTNEVFSKQKLYSDELKKLKDEARGLIEAYKYQKDGLEASVKFYQNLSYILTSYRMEEC